MGVRGENRGDLYSHGFRIFFFKFPKLFSFFLFSLKLQSLLSLSSPEKGGMAAHGGATVFSGGPTGKRQKSKLFTVNPHYFTCSFRIRNLKIKKAHQSIGSEGKFGNLFFPFYFDLWLSNGLLFVDVLSMEVVVMCLFEDGF